ncbi:MAG: molybdopterin molybdotransferase MoeA, partial [Gammaproteobacteria bacterium]|nr:molybdopterin molybdotransferase MoeA [Gammaproteobacteria bacterium]
SMTSRRRASMISYAQALETILCNLPKVPRQERLPLTAACQRILSRAVAAPHDMPPFDQSLMDGFALRSRDTREAAPGQPVRLTLGATLTAGEFLEQPLLPRQAGRIMTGAPIPPGADAVVKMEDSAADSGRLVVHRPLDRWVNVQRRGREIRRRTVVLRPGEGLTPQRIGTALALGLADVDVAQRPRVALVAPGDELLPPGAPLQPAMKWCSNLYALQLRARELGCAGINLGIVPDTLESLTEALRGGLENDLVIILGASGRGQHDFAARAMEAVGAELLFRGVAANPGRGVTVARHEQTLIVGLPGSPWGSFVGFEAFVRPAIRRLLGQPPFPRRLTAAVKAAVRVRPGATHFFPCRLQAVSEGWEATLLGDLLDLSRADSQPLGLLVMPPYRRLLRAGSRASIWPLAMD